MKSLILLVASLCLIPQLSFADPILKTFHVKERKVHAKGLKRSFASKHMMMSMKHLSFKDSEIAVPGAVDLSEQVSLPENQGNCGACWDFSLTKALRSEYMLAGLDPGVLDFNYLLNNCGPGPAMDGCQGGDFIAAKSFENKGGPNLDKNDPYTQVEGACRPLPTLATAQSYTMVGENSNPPTFKDLAYSIGVLHHMLSIDVAAGSGDWENYSDGIYNDCQGSANDIDHMINMVGYNCETSIDANGDCLFDSNGVPAHHDGYLLVENNWGETWGTQASNGLGGYMKTRMYAQDGSHCNAIANDALYFDIEPVQAKKKEGFLCSLFQHLPWCKA